MSFLCDPTSHVLIYSISFMGFSGSAAIQLQIWCLQNYHRSYYSNNLFMTFRYIYSL